MQKLTVRTLAKFVLIVLVGATAGNLQAQAFSCDSTGADGAIDVTAGTTTLDLPADGILNVTTINVAAGATLTFNPNPLNTPAFLLASGDVTIDGTISVKGRAGTSSPPIGGQAGPGGGDGGAPGIAGLPPGAGRGPGAGLGGTVQESTNAGAGGGAYGGRPGNVTSNDGAAYGSPVLIPLVGGSGGGGTTGSPGGAGGGGGGAALLCSNTSVTVTGMIEATGGRGGGDVGFDEARNGGSGGAIRIVAPRVAGGGILDVQGGCDGGNSCASSSRAGRGRIRVDALDRSGLNLVGLPNSAFSVSSVMLTFLDAQPRLDLLEVAGQNITVGAQDPVTILLPVGSPSTQDIRVQASDFTGVVPIDVVLTPENGDPIVVPAEIDMAGGSPAEVTVQADFPLNVITHVSVWTR